MDISTDVLARLNDALKALGWILAALAALALAGEWVTGRALETRRRAEAEKLQASVQASEQEAVRLRQLLAPRTITDAQRARMIELLRATPGRVEVISPADVEATEFGERVAAVLRALRRALEEGFGQSTRALERAHVGKDEELRLSVPHKPAEATRGS